MPRWLLIRAIYLQNSISSDFLFLIKGNLEYLIDVHFDYDTPLIVETGAGDWGIYQILLRGESSLFYLRCLEFLSPKKKFDDDDDDFISLNSRRSASSGV